MKKKISSWWNIYDPIYGNGTILTNTIRYSKNKWHPYGWEIAFSATVIFNKGYIRRKSFGALGTTKRAAMANALPRG